MATSKIDQWLANKQKIQPSTKESGVSSVSAPKSKIDQWVSSKQATARKIPEPINKGPINTTPPEKAKAANYGITKADDLASASAKYKTANPGWKPENDKAPGGVGAALVGSAIGGAYDYLSNIADWAMGTLTNTKNRWQDGLDLSGKSESVAGKYAGGGAAKAQQAKFDAANKSDVGAQKRMEQKKQEAAILRRADPNDTSALAEARRNIEKAQAGIDAVTDLENESRAIQYVGQGIQSLPTTLASRLGPAGMALSGIASFKQSYNQKFDEMEASGKEIDPDKLMTYSIAAAAVEVGSEYIFPAGKSAAKVGYGVLKNTTSKNVFANGVKAAAKWLAKDGDEIVVPTLKAFGKSLLKESGQEGAEEVVSYVGQGILAKMLTNQDDDWSSLINKEGAFQSFMGGAVAGLMFSGIAATPGFVQSRQWLKQNTNKAIKDLTDNDIREIFKLASEDYATAEGKQDLNGGLLRTIAKTQSTGQIVQEPQSGQSFEVLKPDQNGEITLLGDDGGTDLTLSADDLQASLSNGLLTEVQPATQATPASDINTAVNDSSLPVGQPVSSVAAPSTAAPIAPQQQEQSSVAGVASARITERQLNNGGTRRQAEATVINQTTGKPEAEVLAFTNAGKIIVNVQKPGDMTPTRFEFDPDNYQAGINPAVAINEATNGALGAYALKSVSAEARQSFYESIASVASTAVSDNQQSLAADRKTKQDAQRETERQNAMTEVEKAKQEDYQTVTREVGLGMVKQSDFNAIKAVNDDMAGLNIDGYLRPLKAKAVTPVMKEIRKILDEVSGKRVVFVESVGDDRVNEFINDFSKDTVFVNVTGRNFTDALFAVGHGLHHLMVKDGNDAIFTKAVTQHATQKALDKYLNTFESEAYRARLKSEPSLLVEEYVADRAGELFRSAQFWRTLSDSASDKKRAKMFDNIAGYLDQVGQVSSTLDGELEAFTQAIEKYKTGEQKTEEPISAKTAEVQTSDVKVSVGRSIEIMVRANEYINATIGVVDAGYLIPSNDIDGNPTPDFPKNLQPRDRTDRESSRLQIENIIKDPDPRALSLMETAENGAIVIDNQGHVLSGNGRAIAQIELYRTNKAGKLLAYNKLHSPDWGVTGSIPNQPVVVKIVNSDKFNAREFVEKANKGQQMKMGAVEQAIIDSGKIDDRMMRMFDPGEDGDILVASNRDFVNAFKVNVIGEEDLNAYVDKDLQINPSGVNRIVNAVFYRTYSDKGLLSKIAESTDSDVRSLTNGMIRSIGAVLNYKGQLTLGTVYDMDITDDLSQAATFYARLFTLPKLKGLSPLEAFERQGSLILEDAPTTVQMKLLKQLFAYKGMGNRIASFITDYYENISALGNPKEISFFDPKPVPTRDDYLQKTLENEVLKYAKDSKDTGSPESATSDNRDPGGQSRGSEAIGIEQGTKSEAAEPKRQPKQVKPVTPKQKAEAAKAKAAGQIEDFGAKIGGARKDAWKDRGLVPSDLEQMNDAEAGKYVKKDNVWKKADYEQMFAEGISKDVIYFIKQVRDAVPTEPRFLRSDKDAAQIRQRREQYIDFVRGIYDAVSTIKTKEQALAIHSELLLKTGLVKARQGSAGFDFTRSGNESLLLTADLANTLLVTARNWDWKVVREMNKRQFLVKSDEKLPKGVEIVLDDGKGFDLKTGKQSTAGTYYVRQGPYILGTDFESEATARAFIKEKFGEDTGKSTDGKKRFVPRQLEGIHRTGKDYRENNTKNVTGDDYLEMFGFRGGEFGNWVNQEERQVSLNYGYDALADLADVLNLSPKDISLGGKLAIAFGARGQGAAMAHFEPMLEVINLTKMKGAGSLAHEWGHALDFILGKALGASKSMLTGVKLASLDKLKNDMKYKPMAADKAAANRLQSIARAKRNVTSWADKYFKSLVGNMTENQRAKYADIMDRMLSGRERLAEGTFEMTAPIVDELSALRKEITGRSVQKEDRVQIAANINNLRIAVESAADTKQDYSDFYSNSSRFDKSYAKETGAGYWSSEEEMFARAFACYIQDKLEKQSASNDYLVGHAESAFALTDSGIITAYPVGEERQRINEDFDALFAELKSRELLSDASAPEDRWSTTYYSMRQKAPVDTQYSIANTKDHRGNRILIDKYISPQAQDSIQTYAKIYFPQSNDETIQLALKKLKDNPEAAVTDALDVNKGGAINTFLRQMFIIKADADQDYIAVNRWTYVFNEANKIQGQGVQANVIIDKLSAAGNIKWAQQEIESAIGKDRLRAIEAKTSSITKELKDIDKEAAKKVFAEPSEISDELGRTLDETKRKERALKRLEDRIKKYQEELGEFNADAVKAFIDALHGVATVTQQYDKLPKTENPVAFMKWVLKNSEVMHDSWLSAYRIIRNMHGTDEVFMAEIDAYFGDFIPDHRFDHPLPAVDLTPEKYDRIKSAVVAHYSEDFRTFEAMVYELKRLGLDMQNAVIIARMAQKQISDLTREEKVRAVRKILKSSQRNLDELINKIVNLSNEQGLQNEDIAAFVARTMGLPGLTPDLMRLISENSKKIADIKQQMIDDGRTSMTYDEARMVQILKAEIVASVMRQKKSTFLKKVDLTESISLMSNPKTIGRNIIGNFGFTVIDTGKDFVAAGIDRVISKATGREVTVPLPQVNAMAKGFKRGLKEAWYDIWHGIDTSNLDTGYSVPRADVFTSKFGRGVMIGFRLAMQLPDRAFQAAAFDSHLLGLMKLNGITDVNEATEDMLEAAQYAAAYKTFTDDNFLNEALGKAREYLNAKKGWGAGSVLLKFTHVPASILMRTIEYSPASFVKALYYLGKPIYDAKTNKTSFGQEFDQKKFAVSLANGVYGSAVTIGLGVLLTALGLMTGKPEDDNDKRALNNAMGIGRGYMMNWTGLWRFLVSGLDPDKAKPQTGDTWSTYSWFSPMNIGIGIGANIVQDTRNAEEKDMTTWEYVSSTGWTSITSGVESITEMSVLAGLNKFMTNLGYGDDALTAFVKSAAGVPSNFVPQFIKGIREITDNTMRDTYDPDVTRYAIKLMQNKVPELSKYLAPAEPDALGNLREVYQNNGNNIWNAFFNPAIVSKYTPNQDAMMVLNTIMDAEAAGLDRQNVISERVGRELSYKTVGPEVKLSDKERYNLTVMIRKEVMKRYAQIPPNLTLDRKYEEMNNIMNKVSQEIKKAYQAYRIAQGAANQ